MGKIIAGQSVNPTPVCFMCAGDPLIGMLHPARGTSKLGVLIMVAGGPQYRIGGHRQLVLWSRKLSEEGYPVFRFDFRGMGDSYGEFRDFVDVEDDIRAALERFFSEVPSLEHVVLWGECNACSASLFFAHKDPRVKGIVMLNPWVRTEGGKAKAVIKHYYLKRLTERSFWTKVFRLEFDVIGSLRSAARMLALARQAPEVQGVAPRANHPRPGHSSLPDDMLHGLSRFRGQLLLIMSGRDLIAREFDELVKASPDWQREVAAHKTIRQDLEYADHTFSSGPWRNQVVAWGIDWLDSIRDSEHSAPSASAPYRATSANRTHGECLRHS